MANVLIDEMRPRLLTLDDVRGRLGTTEGSREHPFEVGRTVEFRLGEDWRREAETAGGSDPVTAFVRLPGEDSELQLTKDGLLEAGAKIGIPRKLQQITPPHLLADQLNWWFQGNGGGVGNQGTKSFKVFSVPGAGPDDVPVLTAFANGTVMPFSNLRILDEIIRGIRERYGDQTEVLADYKMNHSLELTNVRLIVPGHVRTITGPGTKPNDVWSTGVQYRNSQLGLKPTTVDGYVFRWWCTNGMTDTLVTSGQYSRRQQGQGDEVYEWARDAVDRVLGGLEEALDGVQATTDIPVEQDVNLVLDDLFRQHNVPVREASQVVRNMADIGGDLSMYNVLNAITEVANHDDVTPYAIDRLLRVGGHVAHSASKRCPACRRIQPE